MNRDQELQKLIAEQEKDGSSTVVFSHINKTPKFNPFLESTIEEILSLIDSSELSEKEILSFVMVGILGWTKLHFSKVIGDMGRTHTSINKYIKSAKVKMGRQLDGNRKEDSVSKNEEHLTLHEEIEDIFNEFKD